MYIEIHKCRQIKKDFFAIASELEENKKKLAFIKTSIGKKNGFEKVVQRIEEHYQEIKEKQKGIMHMLEVFNKIVDCYDSTEKGLLEKVDWHLVLDAAGLIPGAGGIFDGVNMGWYMAEGNKKEAILSGLAFLPFAGEVVGVGKTGGKAGIKIAEYADEIGDIGKGVDKAKDTIKGADKIRDVGKYADDVVDGTIKSGSNTNKLFKNQSLLEEHYGKHGQEIADVLGDSNYSVDKYLDDANYIINNGTYAPELNGYVSFISGKKYGFVGLDSTTGDITTFHIKNISELIKKAPSLGFER